MLAAHLALENASQRDVVICLSSSILAISGFGQTILLTSLASGASGL